MDGQDPRDAGDLLEGQQLGARQEPEVAPERLARHAVGAAQVAAIGDRDAQVEQRPPKLIDDAGHAESRYPHEAGARLWLASMTQTLTEIDEARRIVLEHAGALGGEPVALADAQGRVLAVDVDSPEAVPPFDNSAMDGFALRSSDVAGAGPRTPVALLIAGESRAGHPWPQTVGPAQAVAISTGAMLPAGADGVVAVEQTHTRDGHVEVLTGVAPGDYVRLAGEDIRAGQRVLARGTRLGAAELGVLASLGRAEVGCSRRPRVAVITTGDELVALGVELTPGAIHDANAYSVPALAAQLGAELRPVATVPDEAQATRRALESALADADVVVVCGGVSVGVHDHVRPDAGRARCQRAFLGRRLAPGQADLVRHVRRDARVRPARQPRLGDGDVHAARRPRAATR